MLEADGNNLVGSNGTIAMFSVYNIVQTVTVFVPKLSDETRLCAFGQLRILALVIFFSKFTRQMFHYSQRVIPQRLSFYGLAMSRSHYPVAHLRIHPG